jgi:rhodanese-related sulfurtransferase
MAESFEISPQEAQAQLAEKGRAILIDVREPEEFAAAKIPDSWLIPMRSIPAEFQKLDDLADSQTLLVLCHHGVRSLQVVAWLREKGIEDCYSIAGGIDRWSREVDSSIPLY